MAVTTIPSTLCVQWDLSGCATKIKLNQDQGPIGSSGCDYPSVGITVLKESQTIVRLRGTMAYKFQQ